MSADVSGPSHWIVGVAESSSWTPLGRVTLHVSLYEIPATLDPNPETATSGGSINRCIGRKMIEVCNIGSYSIYIPALTGPTTGLGICITATIEMV